jgi:hypothetical protein
MIRRLIEEGLAVHDPPPSDRSGVNDRDAGAGLDPNAEPLGDSFRNLVAVRVRLRPGVELRRGLLP